MTNKLMGLLGPTRDEQFRADIGRGLLDAGNRGAVAGLLGMPVDLMTTALRPFGYSIEKPVMGSEWIGQNLQDAGLVSPQRNMLAETLAAVAAPAAANRMAHTLFAAEQSLAPKAAEMAKSAIEGHMTRNGLIQQMAHYDTKGLPNRGKDLIQGEAERLAGMFRDKGFAASVEHSGSAAGPSSYLTVFDPKTNRLVLKDIRLSGHSKGPWNSQFSRDVAGDTEFSELLAEAMSKRAGAPPYMPPPPPSPLDLVAASARPKVFNAFKDARDGSAQFSKYRAR